MATKAKTLDLTGIDNVGEFYSHHYLDTLLEGDLNATLERWVDREKSGGRRHPEKELAGLSNNYYLAQKEAREARSQMERWQAFRDFHAGLLEALGYRYQAELIALDDGSVLPVLSADPRDSRPYLWVIEGVLSVGADESPLDAAWLVEQCRLDEGEEAALPRDDQGSILSIGDTITDAVFAQDVPPRWVLVLAGSDLFLLERSKWPQGKMLRFRLGELFGRKQTIALRAVVGLLHREALNPDQALPLHDTLDENSHKHAFAVSTDLKHGARIAIELLANEAIRYQREVCRQRRSRVPLSPGSTVARDPPGDFAAHSSDGAITRECERAPG